MSENFRLLKLVVSANPGCPQVPIPGPGIPQILTRNEESLKGLSHQFFTFPPERLGTAWIQRVTAYSFADGADGHVVRYGIADVTILAITAADLLGRSNYTSPHRGCGSLRDRLPLEGRLTLCRKLPIHLLDYGLHLARGLCGGPARSVCLPDARPQRVRHAPDAVDRKQRQKGYSPSSIGHTQ